MSTEIHFVRHAESSTNLDRRFANRWDDASLTERGQAQAERIGAALKSLPVRHLYSSPLRRAIETAEAISRAIAVPVSLAPALIEIDVGEIDQRADREAWRIHDRIVARWAAGDRTVRFPGGESFADILDRFRRFLDHCAANQPDQTVVAVGHGALFCLAIPTLCRIPLVATNEPLWLDHCTSTLVHLETGEVSCRHWGESPA